jgi:hypothetical protein
MRSSTLHAGALGGWTGKWQIPVPGAAITLKGVVVRFPVIQRRHDCFTLHVVKGDINPHLVVFVFPSLA